MHVLVTGGAGFIGSHTCEALVARGHRVTAVDSFDSYLYPANVKERNAADLTQLPQDRFRLVRADICDRRAMSDVITSDVDVVCHLAALAGVRPSLVEPLRYLRTNIEGTGVIIELMREAGLQRLVFASSSSVYGAKEGEHLVAFHEDDPCLRPASPYAASKRMNELQLSTYTDLYGLGVSALRFFTVYGPRQRPDMAIHKFAHAIASGKPISLFGDGSSRRDYTFIDDIVTGVVAAIEAVAPARFEIFNLGGSATISLRDLVAAIEKVVGKPAIIDWQPPQPGDVPVTFANIERAGRVLGYAPKTPVELGIAKYWQWVQTYG
jgi:UDP-glucuronate 4-epimerase